MSKNQTSLNNINNINFHDMISHVVDRTVYSLKCPCCGGRIYKNKYNKCSRCGYNKEGIDLPNIGLIKLWMILKKTRGGNDK